jgi:hypothetical protein
MGNTFSEDYVRTKTHVVGTKKFDLGPSKKISLEVWDCPNSGSMQQG